MSASAPEPTVAVIIPNWNGAHHLVDCLQSLASQLRPGVRVVVVDNGSTDTSLALLASRFPWVEVIALADNLGFSAAVNAGIRSTDSEFVVLLNNDTKAAPDWLERLVDGMRRHPRASFAACKMLLFDPPHRIDSAGDRYSLLSGAGINIGAGEPAAARSEAAWVFGACAGAAIYRRSLFEDIGLFDEDFFLVFEDVDLDLRAQVAGHRCIYLPDAVVYHKRGASTDNSSRIVEVRAWRNLIWVAGKNLPPLLLAWWMLLFWLKFAQLVVVAVVVRGLRKLRPGKQAQQQPARESQPLSSSIPANSWRQGALAGHYLPALRQAFAKLPAKRRALRSIRRLGSLRLLPILVRPIQPLDPAKPSDR